MDVFAIPLPLVDAVIFLCYDSRHGKSAQSRFGLLRA